jgi:hypothetical protein
MLAYAIRAKARGAGFDARRLNRIDVTESTSRLSGGIGLGDALCAQLLFSHIEVKCELLLDLSLHVASPFGG